MAMTLLEFLLLDFKLLQGGSISRFVDWSVHPSANENLELENGLFFIKLLKMKVMILHDLNLKLISDYLQALKVPKTWQTKRLHTTIAELITS